MDDDAEVLRVLQKLYDQLHSAEENKNEDILEDDDESPDSAKANVNQTVNHPTFANYMPTNSQPADTLTAMLADSDHSPPARDALYNSYVHIIHTNGVHHIALVSCPCCTNDQIPLDLMYARFVPTSFKHVRTLFSTDVLDYFHYSSLELKASAYQFFQLLCQTSPMAPADVVDFYYELCQLSYTWWWMKKLKWAGFAHTDADPMKLAQGQLGVFCPACPQAGINISDGWARDNDRFGSHYLSRK